MVPRTSLFLDEPAKNFSAALDRSLPGMLHRVWNSSSDGTVRVVAAWLPGYPLHYYLFDSAQHRLSLLGEERPDIAAGVLGQVHHFSFKTRDGLDESGYVLASPRLLLRQGRPARCSLIVMRLRPSRCRQSSAQLF